MPSDNYNASGAFISMVNLINILNIKYNLDIFVILPFKGNGVELLKEYNISFVIIPSFSWVIPLSMKFNLFNNLKIIIKKSLNYISIRKISKFIENNDIDLVHINTTYSYVGAISAINEKIPLIWHLREFLEEDQNNTLWNREEGNKLINKSDKIIAISDTLKEKYIDVFDSDKLLRIYNGVDDKKFYKPKKEIFNNKKLIFIIVGGLSHNKGQMDLVNACSKLYSHGFVNFEVWFVGQGEESFQKEMISIFDSVGMNNFKFLGYKKNVEEYFEKADISFTCSKFEAFGRVTVEAMLTGNLVIGSDNAGTKELIKDNRGLLYEFGNSDDLYEKIKFAMENPEISRAIAKNGQRYMYENMTAENNAENIFNVYKELLNRKN